MNKTLLLLLSLFVLPLAFAASDNETFIHNEATNTNITINGTTVYYDALINIGASIFWENLSHDNGTETLTFNITETNGSFHVNASQYDLPQIDSASSIVDKTRVITSGLTESINLTGVLEADCNPFSTSQGLQEMSCSTCVVESFSCVAEDVVSYSLSSVDNGDNTLTLSFVDDIARGVLGQIVVVLLIGLIIVTLLLASGNPALQLGALWVTGIIVVIVILRFVTML
jgi:hypothetical protein